MMDNATPVSRYDPYASRYSRFEWIDRFLFRGYRMRLLRAVQGKVLEVGIGTGLNLPHYSSSCNLIGIDSSKDMLHYARERARHLGKKIKLVVGDAAHLPFKNGSFDYVVDTLGLCSYPFPLRALREMKRVCANNGRILLLEHGVSTFSFIRRLQVWREPRHSAVAGCHLLRNPEQLVRQAGLRIVRVSRAFSGIVYVIEAAP